MKTNYIDFSDAEEQIDYTLIPDKTLAKVRMSVNAGGYDDEARGWTRGYATRNETSGAVYLKAEFVVQGGKYDGRKIWSLIGLHSEKGEDYGKMGRRLMRAILESAKGISSKDQSNEANLKRRIDSFADLDGIEFVAKITIKQDANGKERNEIRYAVTPDHKEYGELMYSSNDNGRYKIESGAKKAVPEVELRDDDIPF
jgi:hypothetical protein